MTADTSGGGQSFEPVAFRIVDSPEQIKAFTDPLRSRVLSILTERAATNQQIAQALGEPHAKVLHHVRTLLDTGLIVLVETRIKGGNVEKYYRAVARMFGLRPSPELLPSVISGEIEALTHDLMASVAIWRERGERATWETRRARLPRERLDEFQAKLRALIREYWGGPADASGADTRLPDEAEGELWAFGSVVYRDPLDRPAANG